MGVATQANQNANTAFSNLVGVPFAYTGYLQRQHEKFFEHTAQADYVRPMGKAIKMEMGAKYIHRSNKSNTTMAYDGEEEANVNSLFDHTTQVAAVYTEWMARLGRWSLRAGLRYEYSHMRGSFPDGSAEAFSKDLNDWCPSASVQYKITDMNTLDFNYATTINRPGINYLNPARVETPVSITEGAPGLNSARVQRLSLKFTHIGGKLTFSLTPMFIFSDDIIGRVQGVRDGKNWSSYANSIRSRNFYNAAFAQYSPWATTNISASLNVNYQWTKNQALGLDGWTGYYGLNAQQRMPWKIVLSVGAGGTFGRNATTVYGYEGNWQYHYLSLQRSFLKEDRLTVNINVNNPFCAHDVYKSSTVQGDYTGFSRTVQDSRQASIRISYRFGSLKTRVKTADRSIENDDMIGGIKQGQ